MKKLKFREIESFAQSKNWVNKYLNTKTNVYF